MAIKRVFKFDPRVGKVVEATPPAVTKRLGKPKKPKKVNWSGWSRGAVGGWPRFSDSMSVRPKARKKVMKMLAAAGIPTEINEQGQFKMDSRQHQNTLLKFYNWRNNDGGYGDYDGK